MGTVENIYNLQQVLRLNTDTLQQDLQSDTEVPHTKLMMTMKHLVVVVTLYFQVLNIVSGEQEPVESLFGCWPSNINTDKVLDEDGLSWNEAYKKTREKIAENPEETVCERAYWFLKGWTVKCTRAQYEEVSCGSGIRVLEFSKHKYKSKGYLWFEWEKAWEKS